MATFFSVFLAFTVLVLGQIFPSWVSVLLVDALSQQTVYTLLAGPITGLKTGPNAYEFLGIPYAEPPTGNNRFASPIAYPAAGLLSPCVPDASRPNLSINATAFGSECPQYSGGNENCLFLNIWTTSVSPLALKPVMFWYQFSILIN